MSKSLSEAKNSRDAGFTLVELLVVITILGILSAVVVFAVRGSGDKGERAAVDTDARVLRTAQEIHCAQFGKYANEDELVTAKLLHAPSDYHEIVATADGPCTASGELDKSGYTITCTAPGPSGCEAELPPPVPDPGQFSLAKLLNVPVGLEEGVLLLTGLGCEPYCGHVLRVVNLNEATGLYGVERYDPIADARGDPALTPLGGFSTGEGSYFGSMVLLNAGNCGANCGKVLLHVDGSGGAGWWLYDPDVNTWLQVPGGRYPRNHVPSLTLLRSGKVLVAGGTSSWPQGPNYLGADKTADLYDPSVAPFGSWSPTADLNQGRAGHAAVALDDGSVLVVGGSTYNADRSKLVERFFPDALNGVGEWRLMPPYGVELDSTVSKAFQDPVVVHVVRLNDNRVLVSGHRVNGEGGAEVYDPSINAAVLNPWTKVATCGECTAGKTVTVLANGRVLVIGGWASKSTSALLYDPVGNEWHPAGPMGGGRTEHSAIRLLDNKVLVTGGDRPGPTASYQIYSPGTR